MPIVNLKIIFCVKSKNRHANAQRKAGARHSFITEIAVFSLETNYSCETGYPPDFIRQFNGQFEDELFISDSLCTDAPHPPKQPHLRKNRRRGVCGVGGDFTQASLRRIIHFLL